MKQYLMRYLLISFTFLVFSSCGSLPTVKGFQEETSQKLVLNPYFSDIKTDYVYKAKITTKKHNFGGLLIIKKIGEEHHRVVFTTEFGNKIFDFEFDKDDFKVNYVIDKLDKSIIIRALRNDYGLLVKELNRSSGMFVSASNIIYKTKLNKNDTYYLLSKEREELLKIVLASKRKEKVTIQFKNIDNNIANNIEIKHHNFRMTIHLNYIGD